MFRGCAATCRLPLNADPLYSRIWGFEIATDLSSQMLVDLSMTRNGRDLTSLRVDVDGMPSALPVKSAAVRFQVSNEVSSLQPAIFKGSRITLAAPTDSRESSRLASKTNSTAS